MDTVMDMETTNSGKKVGRVIFTLLLVLTCSACSPKTIEVPKENALIVCLDEVGIKEKDVTNVSIKEKNGFTITFDYKNKTYTFKVSDAGLIKSRQVVINENVEVKEEKDVEEKKEPALSEEEKIAKQAALNNMGVTEAEVDNLSVETKDDGTIEVHFRVREDLSKIVTITESNGNVLNSYYE